MDGTVCYVCVCKNIHLPLISIGVLSPIFRFGLAHMSCFDQWAAGRYVISKSLRWAGAIVFLCLCRENPFCCLPVCPRIMTRGASQSRTCSSKQSHPAESRVANSRQQADPWKASTSYRMALRSFWLHSSNWPNMRITGSRGLGSKDGWFPFSSVSCAAFLIFNPSALIPPG